MRTDWLLTLAVLLVAAPVHGADSIWDGSSGMLPDEVARPWDEFDSADPEDPGLVGDVLVLETTDDAELMYYVQSGGENDPPDPWVIEFEMRLASGTSSSGSRGVARVTLGQRADTLVALEIDADNVFLLSDSATVGESAGVDTDGAFHTFRIEVAADDSVEVYYDDVLTLTGSAFAEPGRPAGRIVFGNSSVLSMGVSQWRSFTHDGFAPVCGDGIVDAPETCDDMNTLAGDGCDASCMIEPVCPVAPLVACIQAGKASLTIVEKKPGNEKLKASLKKLMDVTTLADFGDPATAGGSRYDLCIYDNADQLAAELSVDRDGELCDPKQKPCWKAKGDKGYSYKDPAAASAGVKKIAAVSGPAGKGKVQLQAGNKLKKGLTAMPTGITALLAGAQSATVQVHLSGGTCFEASLGTVKKNDTTQFKAKAP